MRGGNQTATSKAPFGAVAVHEALAHVLRAVSASGYRFTTTTPLTHRRVLANRATQVATALADIFGWNAPFRPSVLDAALLRAMDRGGILRPHGTLLRSEVRIASLGDQLFLHSSFPTNDDAAVFFGPDTYRFVRLVNETLNKFTQTTFGLDALRTHAPVRILDVGCGSGAGGISAARSISRAGLTAELVLNDINPLALDYAAVNAEVAGVPVVLASGDALSAVVGDFDLIISNPPYMVDAAKRAYRDGGERLGRALSVRIAKEALRRLAPNGKLILYTGVAMVDGVDPFLAEVSPLLADSDVEWSYSEIDPDVFGEELEQPAYAHVDRIAAVGLVAQRRSSK
ncbi:HemK family modification methylase [Caballeronia sordidicola]|uniref:HemK family modification methylase n=1 Tax=Caballeronia sordidicola TaxID=196367 RepID=A0A242N439_CABSO|nr:HemK family modification methylase [Caballeronia sordidicola]